MSEVFYRKWRPQRFDQVVGQEAVAQTLRNAVSQDRVAHAYLFCGPRGTGKTSTARVLAKAVNCLEPQAGEPDNQCAMCVAINESRALDLIEIDAASNRGIDDIRSLREKVHFTPNEARYKVYIVDEVHMLTEAAFNALLKTLEEPPSHAIFVLATTEAHKVPPTIISRCQRFDLRRIPLETATTRLASLCADEGIEASPEALALIARTSAGSLRDAENLLEQTLVSYGSPLGEEQVRDLLGLTGEESALELVGHVVRKSISEGLSVINRVASEGNDLRQFHRAVMEYFRGLLLLKSGAESSLGYADETTARLRSLAEGATLAHVIRAVKVFAAADLRREGSSSLPLELAIVESSLAEEPRAEPVAPAPAVGPAQSRGSQAPRPPRPPPSRPAPEARSTPVPNPRPQRDSAPAEVADGPLPTDPAQRLERQWDSIVRSLRTHKGKRFNLGALLRSATEREVEDGAITLKYPHTSHLERMREEMADPQTSKVLKETFDRAMDGSYEIRAVAAGQPGGGDGQSATQRSNLVRVAQAMGARVVSEKEEGIE